MSQHELRDRVVAVVDEEAVLLSDVEEVIGLGLVDRQPGESDEALQARVLEGLIDHQLRFQAAERFGFGQVPVEDIEQQVDAIRDRFPDPAAFAARLAELGLAEVELRQLVARQLMVLNYVDERLGARVFVSLDDIRTYYDDELVPQLTSQGQPVPPLEEVREQIRQVIKQRRLLDEVETLDHRAAPRGRRAGVPRRAAGRDAADGRAHRRLDRGPRFHPASHPLRGGPPHGAP